MFKQLNIKIENTCKSNKGFIEESIEKTWSGRGAGRQEVREDGYAGSEGEV